jgi:hypothetical protein
MKRLITIVPVFSLLLSGCGSLMNVTRQAHATTPGHVDGVPFYVKAGVCKQQTVWLQPIYSLTLKATPPADKGPAGTVSSRTLILTLAEVRSDEFRNLMNAKANEIETKWDALAQKQPPDPYSLDQSKLGDKTSPDNKRVLRVANETVPEIYVDYSTMYFYNTSKPLAGSAQANVELASDGTMTKGSAQAEDKTLQAFLDLLPIKDVLSTVAKAGLGVAAAPAAEPAKYELSIATQLLKHTHFKYLTDKTPPCAPPEGELTPGYNLLTEDVSEPKKKAADGQTISVNGSIQLPKKDDAKPK